MTTLHAGSRSAVALPDEILSIILKPLLQVTDDDFQSTAQPSVFSSYRRCSSSELLLVNRDWLRVTTTLLYEVIVLRSKAQAAALKRAIQTNPGLGRFIRKLRLEGGFGQHIGPVLAASPNITDLYLSLSVYSSDGTSGLVKSLHHINPRRLILFEDDLARDNAATTQLFNKFLACLPLWSNLRVVHFPYLYPQWETSKERRGRAIAEQMAKCVPGVEEIHASGNGWNVRFLSDILLTLASIPSLKRIYVPMEPTCDLGIYIAAQEPENIQRLIRFRESRKPAAASASKSPKSTMEIRAARNPFFVPMAAAPQSVQEAIWVNIFSHLVLNHISSYLALDLEDGHLQAPEPDPSPYSLLLVNRLFYRLARPVVYCSVVITSPASLSSLDATVQSNPAIAREITHVLLYPQRDYFADLYYGPCGSLLSSLSRLRFFSAIPSPTNSNRPAVRMAWDEFMRFCENSASFVRHLGGINVQPINTSAKQAGLDAFGLLTNLTHLEWRGAVCFSDILPQPDDPLDFLPHLETLQVHPPSSSILSLFSRLRLPSLRKLVLLNSSDTAQFFLEQHGSKLKHLELRNDSRPLLQHCLNLETLVISNDFSAVPSTTLFNSKRQFLSLHSVTFALSMKAKDMKSWCSFAESLDNDSFPALRELSITGLQWPTTEQGIARSPWPPLAESFLMRGVTILDSQHNPWRPRLGLSSVLPTTTNIATRSRVRSLKYDGVR